MAERYNAAAWLVDRHVTAGDGDRVAFRVVDDPSPENWTTTDTTYAELQAEVFRAQNALRQLDVRRGSRVALVLNDELTFPAWFLGAMRSGIVPIPLSTMLTDGDLAEIIADAEADAVVLSAAYAGHAEAIANADEVLRHVVVDGTPQPVSRSDVDVHDWHDFTDRAEAPVAGTSADSPAFWLYSSGTTGTPKGVMHRHGSLQATADTYAAEVLRIGRDDRTYSVAKLFFAFGLGNCLTFPLAVGACSVLSPARPTPAGVAEIVRREQPTLFFASPGFVAALLDTDTAPDTFASVRASVTAGEALPAELQKRFSTTFDHPVLDGIGSTECLHIFLSNTATDVRPGTSGRVVPGYEARLVDEAGDVLDEYDVPGYLQVSGPSITTGYWSRDAANRNAFWGPWISTGDVYTVSADGYWTFLGRNSDMIKTGGIWVSPAEVEATLIEHADVLEAAVVGGKDDEGLETTIAFVVARHGATIDEAAIEVHCRERMAAFKRPRRLIVVAELPKTATGKIQRFALRNQLT